MPTAQYLIEAAAKALNVIDAGETLSAGELSDCLVRLNALIGNYNSQELLATAATVGTVAVTANTGTATLGTAYRKVVSASHTISSNFTVGCEMIDAVRWNSLPDRDISGNMIRFVFYDRGATSGVVYLSPKPLANGTLNFTAWAAQSTFAALDTNNTLLPGYERLLITGLAMEIASLWARKPDDSLVNSYTEAMKEIKLLNSTLMGDMSPTPAASAAPVS